MKVLISHNTGATNKGVEKMLTVVLDRLKLCGVPSSSIVAVSNSVDYDSVIWPDIKFIYRANFPKKVWFLLPIWQFGIIRLLFILIGKRNEYLGSLEVINVIADCDLVISIGGDMFSDDYNNLPSELAYIKLAKKYGKKVILLGHTIGKFKSQKSIDLAKSILPLSDLIVLRDLGSMEYLESIGMSMTNVVKKTDLAFSFEEDLNAVIPASWRSFIENRNFIGFNISHGYAKYMDMNYERYLELLSEVIDDILSWYSGNILLIPHVFDFAGNDDSRACSDLSNLINSERVESLSNLDLSCNQRSAGQFKKLISQSDIFVSVRMHSAIAALSRGIPTFLFSYSLKAKSLLKLFFDDPDKYSSVLDVAAMPRIIANIKAMYEDRQNVKGQIKHRLIDIKNESSETVNFIDEFCR
jgi:polysaccharide pyruvyl transferase WcaK-like protein